MDQHDRPVSGLERRSDGEHTADERWMTYAEAGRSLGISAEAARQLAKRRGWPRQTPNEHNAYARVLVPLDTTVRSHPASDGVQPPDDRPFNSAPVADLIALLTAECEARGRADERADRAEARADRAEARTDAAEVRAVRAEARADQVRDQLDAAEAQLREARAAADRARDQAHAAQDAAAALRQAEAARQGRGRWARLRAAWRGDD